MVRRALVLIAAGAFLVWTGITVQQVLDVRHAFRAVTDAWRNAVVRDNDRIAAAGRLRFLVERVLVVAPENSANDIVAADRDLREQADLLGHDPHPVDLISHANDFFRYDADQLRFGTALTALTKLIYHTHPFCDDEKLPPIASNIEGAEAAALSAHQAYNVAVARYRVAVRAHGRIAALLLPNPDRIGQFSLYAEPVPADQENRLDDD